MAHVKAFTQYFGPKANVAGMEVVRLQYREQTDSSHVLCVRQLLLLYYCVQFLNLAIILSDLSLMGIRCDRCI